VAHVNEITYAVKLIRGLQIGLAHQDRATRDPTTGSGAIRHIGDVTADYAEFTIGRAFARPVG
jgi:hypothetical protein